MASSSQQQLCFSIQAPMAATPPTPPPLLTPPLPQLSHSLSVDALMTAQQTAPLLPIPPKPQQPPRLPVEAPMAANPPAPPQPGCWDKFMECWMCLLHTEDCFNHLWNYFNACIECDTEND